MVVVINYGHLFRPIVQQIANGHQILQKTINNF